ncbi:MAG: hypothetical protein A2301_03055 [Candidatus Magasanikbacteria bacterium RIFOXYB2_FULL_40_13]|uniref:Uncharacterized protein n=2 Tax=Candidatus Magasanikiibacteriota TaxID=1752731 RepID=A0A1F6NH03_9BACT|nr:MAG: hypothetical protein A2373_01770 [Candidatus Magasanikbacteria bacterium RIFOXYB1_FULL_40_15]OGH86813.1 MAG: hypothetical protein A2301_03055 [Candidatus Magasanikbacteria bacterium RIFOXYB2_FULL_40_13]OGH87192.1 MAG: hypothetical protein A2206_00340 [Candidatus Magasanikbacteria bacterium RIFOXYA1_FULL_40_8]
MLDANKILEELIEEYNLEDGSGSYQGKISLIAITYAGEEPCILIYFFESIPDDLCLPSQYKGVEVKVGVSKGGYAL